MNHNRFSGRSRSHNEIGKYCRERREKLLSGEITPYRIDDLMVLYPELVEEAVRRLI